MRRYLIAFVCALLLAPAAYADDFTFTVPVRVENMTSSSGARVVCAVYTASAPSAALTASGQGQSDFITFTGGNYTGPVHVVVNLRVGVRRDSIHSYWCTLGYWATVDGRGSMVSGNTSEAQAIEYTRITGQEVASAHSIVIGSIP